MKPSVSEVNRHVPCYSYQAVALVLSKVWCSFICRQWK